MNLERKGITFLQMIMLSLSLVVFFGCKNPKEQKEKQITESINPEAIHDTLLLEQDTLYVEIPVPYQVIKDSIIYINNPVDTFATQSGYLTRYKLPTGSQYAVYSAQSDDVVLEFSQFTKVSDDNTSNYIKLHLDSFQPERYYKLVLKVPNSGSNSTYQIHDNNWIFKVTRSQ